MYGLVWPYLQKIKQIPDNINVIFKTPKKFFSRSFPFGETKNKIWLNSGLYTVKLVLSAFAIFAPFTASAGIFSFIGDLVQNKEADATVTGITSQNMPLLQADLSPNLLASNKADIAIVDGSALIQEAGVNGTQADLLDQKSTQISLYVVRKGDNLSQIAKMFGVSVNTIIWANDIRGSIHEGDELIILPISGVNHIVKKGDTIKSLSQKYKADMGDIISYNNLPQDGSLTVGATVIIPDGELSSAASSIASNPTEPLRNAGGPYYKDYYMRPISGGVRTQGLHGYNGVDLAAPVGTPIHASADGIVIIARYSGYNGGYGSYVVISHPNGTQTLYGHASKVLVSQGDAVKKGDTIALVGSTGKSTGPHVHFEIRGATNPF